MKIRSVSIFTGEKFQVPERIQRIDQDSTHGWQLRYGRPSADPTEFFSDFSSDGSGAQSSLEKAIAALQKRVRRLPAPTGLRVRPNSNKTTDLPTGISGPALRNPGSTKRTPYYCFQVSVPVFGRGNTTKAFYIGTERTADAKREEAALAKASEYREEAIRKYEQAKTRAVRSTAAEVLPAIKQK